jgi:outer membrane protein OmpA-like peptidoglycan-associated protein
MGTIDCTQREFSQGLEVPINERTTIVVGPNAMLAAVVGRAFEPGKSFVLPRALPALRQAFLFVLAAKKAKHALVVAHTDAKEPNADELSADRATAMAAWLGGDIGPWLDCYDQKHAETKRWGSREDRLMLGTIADIPSSSSAVAPSSGPKDERHDELVARYQSVRGLTADGIAGPITRKQLITDYFAQSRPAAATGDDLDEPGASPEGAGPKLEPSLASHGAGSHFSLAQVRSARRETREEAGAAPRGAADASPAPDAAADSRIDFFLFPDAVDPAPANPDGPEYLEWIRLATLHRDFQAGSAGGAETQLALRLFDKTGRHRHANQHYRIAGPESFEGSTDSAGGIDLDDVLPGDYTLTLALRFFEGEDEIVDEHSFQLVVQNPQSEPQVRMIGVVPNCTMARLRGMLFDTDKAFLLPSALESLKRIRELYENHNPGELLVVGHCDTTGDASVNDPLSLDRAKSTLAYLEDDVDTWLAFYATGIPQSRRWGEPEDQHMMTAVLTERGIVPGNDLVFSFQTASGIEDASGVMDTETRTRLIGAYMALDGAELDSGEFRIKGVAHGCGENFPVDDTGEQLDTAPTNDKEDALDRRVELFFFDPEFGIAPAPDGANSTRGSTEYPTWRKRAELTEELTLKPDVVFLTLSDAEDTPIAGALVQALSGETVLASQTTGPDGQCALRLATRVGATLRITALDEAALPRRAPSQVETFTAEELRTGIAFPQDEDLVVCVGLFELDFRLEEGQLPETGNLATLTSADGSVNETVELTEVGDEGFEKEASFDGVPSLGQTFTLVVKSGEESRTVFEGLSVGQLLAEIDAVNANLIEPEPGRDERLARLDGIEGREAGGPSGEVVV